LRLAASIKAGTVAPSTLMHRLTAYPKQNALAKTLREIGRLERTLFTLDWVGDPALRRRANAGLNKGEARNALARAVFFHRLGEIRDRTFENQRYRASGLNLAVAAVIPWNTVYLATPWTSCAHEVRPSATIYWPISRRLDGGTSPSMATTSGRRNRSKTAFRNPNSAFLDAA
jgi:TnpA family transposase